MTWTNLFGGRTFLVALVAISALLPPMAGAEEALSPPAQRGLVFVRTHCAKCHAIDRISPSPLAAAPPFRKLHERYPVETLQESLAEGIVTGHPAMPEFQLDPGQVNDVITYLKSQRYLLTQTSCAGLTRASMLSRLHVTARQRTLRMDRRVKPRGDGPVSTSSA